MNVSSTFTAQAIEGIGQAMLEHTVYDRQSGQLLSGSLTDYAVPRADDLPRVNAKCIHFSARLASRR